MCVFWILRDSKSILKMHYSSVPEWLQVPFINTGYVYPNLTHSECIRLLFKWHNQTLNAWTMIISGIVSTYLYSRSDLSIAFTILWLSAVFHMPFAVANHLFRHISREHYVYYKNLDMQLILICSVMLTFSLSYHVFSMQYTLLNTCISLFTAACASQTKHEIGLNTNKIKHVLMFLLNILSYLAPVFYKIQMYESQAILACASGALIIYISGFPERVYKNYDIIGASHQLMHILSLCAHVFEFYFIRTAPNRHVQNPRWFP